MLVCAGLAVFPALGSTADGQLDPSFGADATGRTIVYFERGGDNSDSATAVVVDPASREIFVGGSVEYAGATTSGFGIARLSPQGILAGDWGNLFFGQMAGVVSGEELAPLAAKLDSGGAPALVGVATPSVGANKRIFHLQANDDGSSETTAFSTLPVSGGGTAEPTSISVTVDPSGRSLVCGITDLDGDSVAFVARLTPSGALDTSFGTAGSGWFSTWIIDPAQGATWCEAVETDATGRLMLLLRGLNYSTLQAFGGVQRRTADGSLIDATFGSAGLVTLNSRPDNIAEFHNDLAVSDDGDIFVVGFAQGPTASSMAAVFHHLSSDGSVVTPFEFYVEPGPSFTYTRFELIRAAVDPAGRLVAGGTFKQVGGSVVHRMAVVRFSTPFVFDSSFGTGGFAFVSFTDVSGFSRERAELEDLVVGPYGRTLLVGRALYGSSGDNYDFAVARLTGAAIFLDGFETGNTSRWSAAAP